MCTCNISFAGTLQQHQYVILPGQQEEDPSICIQADPQVYTIPETVYTLNSHSLQQSTEQLSSSIQDTNSFKTGLQFGEPVNYTKNDNVGESVTYTTTNEFQEPDNQVITEESDCATNDNSQEPVCYRPTDEIIQPVNYSKNNLLQNENGMINLLQNDQSVVLHNLNNLNLQQTETPTCINSLNEVQQSHPKLTECQSVLREHLIGSDIKSVNENLKPEALVKNVHVGQQPKTRTMIKVLKKRSTPKTQHAISKFQYTMNDIEEAPKTCKHLSALINLLR